MNEIRSLCCRIITIATWNPNWPKQHCDTKQGEFSLECTGNWLRILIIYLTDKRISCRQSHMLLSHVCATYCFLFSFLWLSFLTGRIGLYIFDLESKLYSFFITVNLENCTFLKFFPLQKNFSDKLVPKFCHLFCIFPQIYLMD